MAVNPEARTFPRKGATLFPLGIAALALVLAATLMVGLLVGRWTAPSATGTKHAETRSSAWVAEADTAGFTGRLGFSAPLQITGSNAWVAEARVAGFTGTPGFSTGFTGRLGFSTPSQGPASGWGGAARDAGYTGRLGTAGS